MFKFRPIQTKQKVVYLCSLTSIFIFYSVLPTLLPLLADCAGSGSGAGCAG